LVKPVKPSVKALLPPLKVAVIIGSGTRLRLTLAMGASYSPVIRHGGKVGVSDAEGARRWNKNHAACRISDRRVWRGDRISAPAGSVLMQSPARWEKGDTLRQRVVVRVCALR
jgi:hypothetical protein